MTTIAGLLVIAAYTPRPQNWSTIVLAAFITGAIVATVALLLSAYLQRSSKD